MVEKRQNKWLLQKLYFFCSPAMSKSNKFPKKWFWQCINIFAIIFLRGWQCFLFIREHFLSFKKCGESFHCKLTLFWHCWRTTEVLFLKQPLILPFLCLKSVATPLVRLTQIRSLSWSLAYMQLCKNQDNWIYKSSFLLHCIVGSLPSNIFTLVLRCKNLFFKQDTTHSLPPWLSLDIIHF